MATLFLSHSSRDRATVDELHARMKEAGFAAVFLDYDPDQGIEAGRKWELALYSAMQRSDAVVFAATEASVSSKWCFAEIALARSTGKLIFPLRMSPGVTHSLLADVQWVSPATEGETAYSRLWEAMKRQGLDPSASFDWDQARSPYPGLAAFRAEDAAVFFGRADLATDVISRLEARRRQRGDPFLCLVGPSGSGKSSLVRAGVVPRLLRRPGDWVVADPFVPGARPVTALARSLAVALSGAPAGRGEIESRLRADPGECAELMKDIVASRLAVPGAVLLIVDQAEELLRSPDSDGPAEEERRAFMAILAKIPKADPHVQVVATLRSEFLGAMAQEPHLAELVRESIVVGPLPRARLTEVIEGPGRRAGLRFEGGLVQQIVAETRGGEALPLLGYTLEQLYVRREPDGLITERAYTALGGVEGALRQRAQEVQDGLHASGHGDATIPALLRLVVIGENDVPLGRPARLGSFDSAQRAAIEALVEARLLSTDGDVVQVAHETLLGVWPPLRQAITDSRDALRTQADLERLAREWERAARNESYLLRGERLIGAEEWLRAQPPAGSGALLLADFISRSRAAADAAERERQALYDRAEARRLGAQADLSRLSGTVPVPVVLGLGVASLRRMPTLEGDVATRRALETAAVPLSGWEIGPRPHSAVFSADGNMMAYGTHGSEFCVLDFRSGESMALRAVGDVWHLAFAGGDRLVIVSETGWQQRVMLLDLEARELVAWLDPADRSCQVAVSPDGAHVAVASSDIDQGCSGVRIYETVRGEETQSFPYSEEAHAWRVVGERASAFKPLRQSAGAAAFSPDGRLLAVGWDTHVSVFDLARREETIFMTRHALDVAFNATGQLLACGESSDIVVYDLSRDTEVNLDQKGSGWVRAIAFGTDHDWRLALARADQNSVDAAFVEVFSIMDGLGSRISRIPVDRDINSMKLGALDSAVVVGDRIGRVQVFDARTGRLLVRHDHSGSVRTLWCDEATERHAGTATSAGADGTVQRFALEASADIGALRAGGRLRTVSFTPGRADVLAGGKECGLWVWPWGADAPTQPADSGREPRRFLGQATVDHAFVTRDERFIVASYGAELAVRSVVTLSYPDGAELSESRFDADVRALALSPAGLVAAVGLEDKTIQVIEAGTGAVQRVISLDGIPWGLAFSPEGEWLAIGSLGESGGAVEVFAVPDGRRAFRHEQGDAVPRVAFSPDGSRVVTAGWDGTVRVHDPVTGVEQLRIGHDTSVQAATFSHDGSLLASAAQSGDVRVFDARTGVEVSRMRHPPDDGWLNDVAFSPDDSVVASAGDDWTVRIWPLGAGLIRQAEERITREPTPAEWQRFFAESPDSPA